MMLSFSNWLEKKSLAFANNIYLIDDKRQVTYSENLKKVKRLTLKLNQVEAKNIIFIGSNSIDAYQLYYAVIAANLIWVPVNVEPGTIDRIHQLCKLLNSAIIVYDQNSIEIDHTKFKFPCLELTELFNEHTQLINSKSLQEQEITDDRIISMYLTSGSTGESKLVQHGWHATLQHAHSTVERYQFTAQSRLFNPRRMAHASGAFPLIALLHCGACIVISANESIAEWAILMHKTNVTHASFFPVEMFQYANYISSNPSLKPSRLQRITTGGEAVEFSKLIEVSRAFAANQWLYDYLWVLYPYFGNGYFTASLIALYEYGYGRLVQVTQTYGATELICNAIANTPMSGPDPRGIGTPLHGVHIEIVNEEGMLLPQDGKTIGQLKFFGNAVASGYLGVENKALTPHCFITNDLATISPQGYISFFGRKDNLIKLPGVNESVNPFLYEKLIKQPFYDVKNALVFEFDGKLHAAIEWNGQAKQILVDQIKMNDKLQLIAEISIWATFPLLPGNKLNRNQVIKMVKHNEIPTITIQRQSQLQSNHYPKIRFCTIV